MTKKFVKTSERAKEIITNYIKNNNLGAGRFTDSSCECECGETELIMWDSYESDTRIVVGVCDSCGDDDLSEKEAIEMI